MRQTNGSWVADYLYHENGTPLGFAYYQENGTPVYYLYETNLQGDVVAIYDANGNKVVSFTYDAWGNFTANVVNSTVCTNFFIEATLFRYRGYIYDYESNLYYLQSRYYDPETGRFISADGVIANVGSLHGYNTYSYCFNNPINFSDSTGNWPNLSTVFSVVAVVAVVVAAVAVTIATCGIATPALAVAGGGVIGGISATTAASVATWAMFVAEASMIASVMSDAKEEIDKKADERNNSVYVLKDDTGTVQYVGRTNSVDKRRAAHRGNPARADLEFEVIASGLTLRESRALEQSGMAYYHTINTANKMNNQIDSVSPKYWGAFKELALGTLNYGWNQMSNEILYWTGN